MRFAVGLLLLLAACRPAQDVESIQRALAKTPIDVAALEEAFKPQALKIHAPALPAISTSPPAGPWSVENASARPVWLSTSALRVVVSSLPFLPPEERYGGVIGGRQAKIERPSFQASDWVLLPPGGRTGLSLDATLLKPGTLVLAATIDDAGARLIHAAREFNQTPRSAAPAPALATALEATFLLPPADWPGAPWHGAHAVEPVRLDGRRFELVTPETAQAAMRLEAFVVGDRVIRMDMKLESFESGRAVYASPAELPPGNYRILFRTHDAADYFLNGANHKCGLPDGAASRWIQFRLE